ncbi:1289_t:CDS:10, partial [Ambispora leptoticha]
MPSVTLGDAKDKPTIKKAIPTSANKIITATVARLYVAYPDPNAWTYANIVGAVVFLRDLKKKSFFFRIVDLNSERGVIWEQELYQDFQYNNDTPFFHTFATDEYVAAFSFADENEATTFHKKVINREKINAKAKSSKKENENKGFFGGGTTKKKKGKKNKVDKALIGQPTDFRHLGHIGYNPDTGFDVQNIDPNWQSLFDQLGQLGVTQDQITKNADFIKSFVEKEGGLHGTPAARKKAAPPPPPSKVNRRHPPPPPARTTANVKPNKSPPPPPPSRKPVAPITPTRDLSPSPPVAPQKAPTPPPPPAPVVKQPTHKPNIPPPPPPIQRQNVPSSPPPVPPPLPNLLQEIQRTGGTAGASLRKVGEPKPRSSTFDETEPPSPSAGGDLAKALANALFTRSIAIGNDS